MVPEEPVVEEVPQAIPEETVIEEQPVEIIEVEVPKEDGETVKQKITKRKIKKQQGPQQEIIEVTTVEEEGKEPEVEITVEDVSPVIEEEAEKPKPKKKKVVKVKPSDEDEYIRQVICFICYRDLFKIQYVSLWENQCAFEFTKFLTLLTVAGGRDSQD